MTNELDKDYYNLLVEDCKAIIVESVHNSNWTLIAGYHALGERIVEDERYQKYSSDSILPRLAKDIKTSTRTLYRAIKFFQMFPDLQKLPEGKNINWYKIINKYLTTSSGKQKEECVCPICNNKHDKTTQG